MIIKNPGVEMLARAGFDAYNGHGHMPWLSHDGKPVPKWDDIEHGKKDQIHGKWMAAADAIARMFYEQVTARARAGATPQEAVEETIRLFAFSAAERRA